MAADRDIRTRRYVEQPLPRQPTVAEAPPDLAAVFGDGGRMRTREPDRGQGVHQPHWRETKNAGFHRMQSRSFAEDPQGELPDCFCSQAYVEKLVNGLKCLKNEVFQEGADVEPLPARGGETVAAPLQQSPPWQPTTVFRTCLSSLAGSDEFGAMMAAELTGEVSSPRKNGRSLAMAWGTIGASIDVGFRSSFRLWILFTRWNTCTPPPKRFTVTPNRVGGNTWRGRTLVGKAGWTMRSQSYSDGNRSTDRCRKSRTLLRPIPARSFMPPSDT